MSTLTDWRGNEIREGVTVVYPGRHSSSLWMNEGIVTKVDVTVESQWSWREKGMRDVTVRKLKVRRTKTTGYGLVGMVVTLTVLDRVTVVV